MVAALSMALVNASSDGFPWIGLIIPAITFIISFGLTWWLYRHFSSK